MFAETLKAILVLFAIVNPIGSVPLFLQLTGHLSPEERGRAFRTAVRTSLVILFAFIIAGEWILRHVFRIQMNDGIRHPVAPVIIERQLLVVDDDAGNGVPLGTAAAGNVGAAMVKNRRTE